MIMLYIFYLFDAVIRIALNMRYGKHLTEATENLLYTRYV